jgi:hypothetical protein
VLLRVQLCGLRKGCEDGGEQCYALVHCGMFRRVAGVTP